MSSDTAPTSNASRIGGAFWRSPGSKFFLICGLILLLIIPLLMVWGLIEERARRAASVAQDVGESWGGAQSIAGPFLAVPFTRAAAESSASDGGRIQTDSGHIIILPERLQIDADVDSEVRQRSIFEVSVYRSALHLAGRFEVGDLSHLGITPSAIRWRDAMLVLHVSDTRAIKKASLVATLNDAHELNFEPSLALSGVWRMQGRDTGAYTPQRLQGIHADLGSLALPDGFDFEIELAVNGTRSLGFAPVGRTTHAAMKADWPHPSFSGMFLPGKYEIGDEGFTASWDIPHLARNYPQVWLYPDVPLGTVAEEVLQVDFVNSVDFYQLASRATKYAILFVATGFLAVFVMEVLSNEKFHLAQYLLVGLALLLFYVLLLSLAEHLGFLVSYIIAAFAISGLCAVYVGVSLSSHRNGVVFFVAVALLYGLLYLTLQLEDYALLAGSLFAFFVLAIVMYVTRRLDWSGQRSDAARQAE